AWTQAMAKIDSDPDWQDRLIEELRGKARPVTDMENAGLLHRRVDLTNELEKSMREAAQAYDDGRMDAVEESKLAIARWSDKLSELEDATKKGGTETGRALAARKMMANEDFSLARMVMEKRAANDGKPLTAEQTAEITRLHQQIAEMQKRLDDYQFGKDERASKTAMEEMLNKLLKEKDKKPKTQVDIAADRKTALEDLRRRVDEGEKPAQLGNLIQRLARGFGGEGVRDRERLIDLVHGVVQGIIPDWERRQTIDAISGYGDFKQLSKDQISVVLRGMKGEMQQLAKLEDMAAGQPPLKSGVERRTPTEAERELIKRVNKAKFEFQIPVKDPATQLQSALDTMKKTLRTRTTDYDRRLKEGDFAPRVRRELKLDTTAVRLKAEAQKAKEA